MRVSRFVILIYLSYALSKSTRKDEPKETSQQGTILKTIESLPRSLTRNLTNIPPHGRNDNTVQAVETLFIPEDPNQYEEIVNYVRKLLEESTRAVNQEATDEDSAEERRHQTEESDTLWKNVEDESGFPNETRETNPESVLDNKSGKESFPETSENARKKFSKEEVRDEVRKNSSLLGISKSQEKYLYNDSNPGIPSRKAPEYGEDNLKSTSEINGEVSNHDERIPNEEDVLEAADFGLRAMHELYYVKEPTLYSMGLYLDKDNPARFVAAFNDQTEEARTLAKYGFAVLQSTTMFMKKFLDVPKELLSSRRSQRNPLRRNCPNRGIPDCPPGSLRYRTSDGSCNNLVNLWWGSSMSSMQRFLPAVYQDGIQTIRRSVTGRPLPSAREVSNIIHEDRDVPLASITHMLMQWGQFVDHDLTATGQSRGFNGTIPQCCLNGGAGFQPPEFMHPECLPIAVSHQDSFFSSMGVRCLEFLRSGAAPREDCEFGPREQLSQVTSYLDASTVYSSNPFHSDTLRLFRNGLLQYGRIQSRRPLLPRQDTDLCKRGSLSTSCFRAGDGRLSEQPALTSLHVVFLRLHNRIATKLAALNFHWSDEKLFQETRRIVGAIVQHITYREFLPIILGQDVMRIFSLEVLKKGYYEEYNPTVNPTVANGFSTAAYRFGHSLVQHSFVRFDSNHVPIFNNVSIHDEFSNPVNLETAGSVDRILLGLINQPSQRRDEFISEELTNHLFQTPRFPFGMDLASLNIQRGRDHGIPPYVRWRAPCGLLPIKSFDDLNRVMPPAAVRKFRLVYSSVEDIDLFPAGLAESSVSGGLVGPTFACIIGQQFSNLRRGDRFWYENGESESSFTPGQLQQIRRVTLAQVLCTTMDNIDTIQPFVFLTQDTFRNRRLSCEDPEIGNIDLEFWTERPPEVRGRENNFEKDTRKNVLKGVSPRPSTKGENDSRVGVKNKEQQKFIPQRQQPLKTNIHQQNRIIVKRPLGPPDNVTIVVQNNAVNSPVFVNDAIYGSHIRIQPTSQYQTSTVQPLFGFAHRPVNQDVQSVPAFSTYNPAKPKPTSIATHQAGRPYVPHGFDDPSNPNPLNQGYQSAMSDDVIFESFSMTSPRPTLYTYYTNSQKVTTQKPPQMDAPMVNYKPQEQTYVPPGSSTNSWSNLEANYELNDQSLTKPGYSVSGNSQIHNDHSKPDNWDKFQHQHRPSSQQDDPGDWNTPSYPNRPSRPSIQHNDPGNWDSPSYQNRPTSRPSVLQNQHDPGSWNSQSNYNRPDSRPNYDDFPSHQVKPNVRPHHEDDYTTWSSVSYQAGPEKLDNQQDSEPSKRPLYQTPSKRPVQADPDGWSTIPSYQEGSSKPSTHHNPGTWSNNPHQAAFTNKPHSDFPSYGKVPTTRPFTIQKDPTQFASLSPRPESMNYPNKNTQHDNPYNIKTPSNRPLPSQTTFDKLNNDAYQRPNRPSVGNDDHYHYSNPISKPSILENHSGSSQLYAKPLTKPLSDQIDKLPDNPYQTPTRPEQLGYQLFKNDGNSKPAKVQSVTIVTESTESIGTLNYHIDRIEDRITSEIPRPLSSSVNKDHLEIRKPGQYYYEKNVLHRYPDKLEDEIPKQSYHLIRESVEERHKVIPSVETVVNPVINATEINPEQANESKVLENNGSKTMEEIRHDDSHTEDGDVLADLGEAFTEGIESASSSARRNYWLHPREDSSLPSTMELPRIPVEEVSTGMELPEPIKLRSHSP